MVQSPAPVRGVLAGARRNNQAATAVSPTSHPNAASSGPAVVFVLTTEIDWAVVGVIAIGSTIGGQVGAKVGRRLDPRILRGVIVCVGLVALVRLIAG